MTRKIIHIDMDCFYAAIEIRDRPELKNKPVAIGGAANKRGVLSTCNYVARQYGLHSAMPSYMAEQRCPQLVLLPVNMDKYRAVSKRIHDIFKSYTAIIEPIALDEAFLDVTGVEHCSGSATWMATEIRERIYNQEKITASAGVAPNKFLAKVASDWQKPNGQWVITPENVSSFIKKLPVKKIPGVGKVMTSKLQQLNIENCEQLQQIDLDSLVDKFGRFGETLYERCRGIDNRAVQTNRIAKSVSVETTLLKNANNVIQQHAVIDKLYQDLQKRLRKYQHRKIHKLFVKLKFSDFSQTTVERINNQCKQENYIPLLETAVQRSDKAVRLIGLGVRFLP